MPSRHRLLPARNIDQFDRIDTTRNTTKTGDSQAPRMRRGRAIGGRGFNVFFFKIIFSGARPPGSWTHPPPHPPPPSAPSSLPPSRGAPGLRPPPPPPPP